MGAPSTQIDLVDALLSCDGAAWRELDSFKSSYRSLDCLNNAHGVNSTFALLVIYVLSDQSGAGAADQKVDRYTGYRGRPSISSFENRSKLRHLT